MRRAIIHIGTPRTGTSAFQTLLLSHRDQLLDRGVLYPNLTPCSSPLPHLNHQHLGEAFGRKPENRKELLTKLDSTLADTAADVVLLSYESFCLPPHRTAAPKLLCGLLARRGFRPEVLMTVRPQASYILSQYTWRIQFLREARPFRAAFLKDFTEPRYDYLHSLRTWARLPTGACTRSAARRQASAARHEGREA